jgi:hypothetical protein
MAQSKLAYVEFLTEKLKSQPAHFPDDATSFNDSDIIVDLEFHLCLNSNDPNINASTNTCITGHKCTVCLGVPREPVMLIECGHIFCETCIKKVIQPDDWPYFHCPTCRSANNFTSGLARREKWPCLMRQIWSIMRVRCKFCQTFLGSPSEVDYHERWKCEKRIINGAYVCCSSFVGTIDQVVEHVLNCPHVLVCCLGCNYFTFLSPIEKHNCEVVKKSISMLPLDSQGRIRTGRPGQFGNDSRVWSVEQNILIEEPLPPTPPRTPPSYDDGINDNNPPTPSTPPTPPTSETSPTPPPQISLLASPNQAPNPALNTQTPTSTPALSSTPNAPNRRRRSRQGTLPPANIAEYPEVLINYVDSSSSQRRRRRTLFD